MNTLSGSGKSTLIRHFNRLIEPSAGEVVVRGRDVCKLGSGDLRELRAKHIGMVFQHVALLPYRTVLQNVSLPLEVQQTSRSETLNTCRAALQTVGLGNWVDRCPGELSGGMQQRVGIARAASEAALGYVKSVEDAQNGRVYRIGWSRDT